MHIRKLTLENIRCFRQLSLDFTRNGAVRPWRHSSTGQMAR